MRIFGEPLELLILDVDGVILEVDGYVERNMKVVAGRLGLPTDCISEHFADIKAGRVRGLASLREGVKFLWPYISNEDAVTFAVLCRGERRKNPWPAIPGSIEALNWFRGNNLIMAICTTNDHETLNNQFLAAGIQPDWFAAYSVWGSKYRKPHPKALDEIFEIAGVPRKRALYIGDWHPDLEVARGAGVKFFATLSGGIARDFFIREGVPENHIISCLSDLTKILSEHR